MAKLIVAKSDSSKTRTCDGRCYNAKGGKCTCVCRGINHSKGLKQATINVQLMSNGLIKVETKSKVDLYLQKDFLGDLK